MKAGRRKTSCSFSNCLHLCLADSKPTNKVSRKSPRLFLFGKSPHPQPFSRSWRPRAKGACQHHSLSREERAGESQGKGFIPSPIMPGMGEGQGEGYFRVRGILLPTFLKLYLYPSQLLRLLL